MQTLLTSAAQLVLDAAEGRRVIAVENIPFTIGRSVDRNLSLANPQVSREHASIDHDRDGFILLDGGSRHGTFRNGERVTSTRLRSGDAIRIGTSCETFLFGEHNESTSRNLSSRISEAVAGDLPAPAPLGRAGPRCCALRGLRSILWRNLTAGRSDGAAN
jgi:pSer/pThr/pTyr-binding forkhead associated (FHA) protein